ncbi:hypothetical protein TanjilG_03151 [Lupinus angustifolius]|uniref:Uncharacterized protein n=1 Tax=Lupinus angustifolius TaxID=3871 RepID=A0A4P1RDS3_LUPAN|nr:PREDICTED: uncharacterized protein At5g41620-like [Lupinus angustifolius]OIW08475.1 hypothetical protein TanjilG_03151 [Lupinus angustifolius]
MPSCQIQTNNLNEVQVLKENNNSYNKIRKRGCSSSSSSSLVRRRRYRFKRAILVGKKGGTRTPVLPMWMTKSNSPSMATQQPLHSSGIPFKDKEVSSVSARKLAATLWEINDLPPSRTKKDFEVDKMRSYKETMIRSREKVVSMSGSGLFRPHMSDPSHSPTSERMKGFEGDGCKRRVSALSHQHHSGDYYLKGLDSHSSACFTEEAENQQRNKKNRLKESRSGLSTSKKLLKVLNQVCHREQQSSSMSLILALGSELDRVCHQIDQLIREQDSSQNGIEHVMKQFAEERAAWKKREREKIHEAIKNVAEELEVEKKLRRQTERLNKKIATEMANVKASHLKLSKELEREKRAKEIMEQTCDELARGIGEDRARVQELKRESAKAQEEVEKEREMLQLADVLREERVQMKLSEAKYQFEEKNAVLEKVRNELEVYMRTKEDEKGDVSPDFMRIKDLVSYFNEFNGRFQNAEKEDDLTAKDGEEHERDESDDGSDLHSIELKLDDDSSGFKWSFAHGNVAQDDSKRVSVDKESIGRKSLSEIIQWGNICFNKGTTCCGKSDFGISIQESSHHFDLESSTKILSRPQIQDDDDETESYSSMIGPQDSMSCSNPVPRNDRSLIMQYTGEAGGNSLVLEGENLK